MGGPLSSPIRPAMPFTAAEREASLTCASRSRPVPASVSSGTACRWASAVASWVPMACRYFLGWHGQVGEVLAGLFAPHPLHDEQGAGRSSESSAKSGRATGTPPWSCTARRMANSSDALVANSPIGRSLRTMTSFGSSVVPESETSNVSLERPPGTTSSWVTRRSGESGNRRRRYACSSSHRHRALRRARPRRRARAPRPGRSVATRRRARGSGVRRRRADGTAAVSAGSSLPDPHLRRRPPPGCRNSTKRSGVTDLVTARVRPRSASNSAPNSWLSAGAHSSSTTNSARIRSTKPAASFAVALVSSGAKTVAIVRRSWR